MEVNEMVALTNTEVPLDTNTADREADKLKTIAVAGVASGAGKTSLAEAVISFLAKDYATGAAKITVTHGERGCPHGGKGCNVCSSLGGDFQVISKASVIEQAGTDTARLSTAGAYPVVWAITKSEMIIPAWEAMRIAFSDVEYVVIESNTLAQKIQTALTLMIVDPTVSRRLWKPSATDLIKTADLIVFNNRGTSAKREATIGEILTLRGALDSVMQVEHPHEAANSSSLFRQLLAELKSKRLTGAR